MTYINNQSLKHFLAIRSVKITIDCESNHPVGNNHDWSLLVYSDDQNK